MGGGRSPKRQRKKERRDAKREARMWAAQRARRQRLAAIVITILVLLGGGAGAFFLATGGEDTDTAASPSPAATPAEEGEGATPDPEVAACEPAEYEPPGEERPTYEEPGDAGLDPAQEYTWRIETTCGQIDIRLAVDRAPKTTNSIAFLSGEGFFEGLAFHRVAKGFVIQGGDPTGTGSGGPGYQVEEPPPQDLSYNRGAVAMAKAGNEPPGTSGSQFFVMSGDSPLPAEYALVGEVTSGMEVIDSINNMELVDVTDAGGTPDPPVHIIATSILEA